VTDVRFLPEDTAFVVTVSEAGYDDPARFQEIIEHWEDYNYTVGTIEIFDE